MNSLHFLSRPSAIAVCLCTATVMASFTQGQEGLCRLPRRLPNCVALPPRLYASLLPIRCQRMLHAMASTVAMCSAYRSSRITISPSGDAKPCVSFIDCRLLLQGWSLECSESGQIDHAELVDWLDTFSPPDWQPQLLNVLVDNGLVQSSHGGVIVAEYVPLTTSEEPPDHTGSDGPPQHDAGPDADDPEDDSESSDLSSDSADDADAQVSSARPCLRHQDRSRSPRRGGGNATSCALTAPGTHQHGRALVCVLLALVVLLQQNARRRVLMWLLAFSRGAVADGRLAFTSVLLLALLPCASAAHLSPLSFAAPPAVLALALLCLLDWYRDLCTSVYWCLRLLVEPSPVSVGGRVQLAVLPIFCAAPRCSLALFSLSECLVDCR